MRRWRSGSASVPPSEHRGLEGPVPFRGGGFSPIDRTWASAATLVGVVALWQAGASAGIIPTLFLPAPVSIARALWALTISGELRRHLSALLMRVAGGGGGGPGSR